MYQYCWHRRETLSERHTYMWGYRVMRLFLVVSSNDYLLSFYSSQNLRISTSHEVALGTPSGVRGNIRMASCSTASVYGKWVLWDRHTGWSRPSKVRLYMHDDVIKWKHFPRYWPFVRGIHRWPVNSPHKGQWRGAMMFSLICAWRNDWVRLVIWDAIASLWRNCNETK